PRYSAWTASADHTAPKNDSAPTSPPPTNSPRKPLDFDGTLADTFACIVASVDVALSDGGFPAADRELLRSAVGLSLPTVVDVVTGASWTPLSNSQPPCCSREHAGTVPVVLIPSRAFRPQDDHAPAFLPGSSHHVGGSTVTSRRLSVPHGEQF